MVGFFVGDFVTVVFSIVVTSFLSLPENCLTGAIITSEKRERETKRNVKVEGGKGFFF